MFHYKEDNLPIGEFKKLIRKAFQKNSSFREKDLMNKTDFKAAWLYLFGYKISKYELQDYFERLEKDYYKDGLNYEQFEKKVIDDIKRLDNIEELRNSFIALDFSCKGFLTIDDLIKQFEIVAPHLSKKTIQDTFREMDRDADGRISYKDFELAMQYIDDELDIYTNKKTCESNKKYHNEKY